MFLAISHATLSLRMLQIAVVESATAAWQQVFYGIPFGQGDRIITSSTEYAANFIAFLQVSATGFLNSFRYRLLLIGMIISVRVGSSEVP